MLHVGPMLDLCTFVGCSRLCMEIFTRLVSTNIFCCFSYQLGLALMWFPRFGLFAGIGFWNHVLKFKKRVDKRQPFSSCFSYLFRNFSVTFVSLLFSLQQIGTSPRDL